MGKRLNSPDERATLHYVTLNIRDRRRAFSRPDYAQLALDELRFECNRHPALLIAYVVMPDHMHFIFWPRDGSVSRFLARYKPAVTKKVGIMALTWGRQKEFDWLVAKGRRELWQDSKFSLPLYSSSWIQQKIDYLHANPIRAGYIKDLTEHYPWSSIAAYMPELQREPPVAVDAQWESESFPHGHSLLNIG